MYEETKLGKLLKVPFFESLCHFSLFCKKSREARLREKVVDRFDESLDIRSFVSVRTNLAILMSLLLKKEQLLLFELNKSHTISHQPKKEEDQTDLQKVSSLNSLQGPSLPWRDF